MEIEAAFVCIYCLQINEMLVDPSGGMRQELVQDCEVCCRPNRLVVTIDEESGAAEVEVGAP